MEQETETINRRPLVIGDFIYDMFPHQLDNTTIRNIQNALGLLPSDDDGLGLLHKEADKRAQRIYPLSDELNELCGYAAETVVEYAFRSVQAKGVDITGMPDQLRQVFNAQNTDVLQLAVPAIISYLIDRGVLALNQK